MNQMQSTYMKRAMDWLAMGVELRVPRVLIVTGGVLLLILLGVAFD